MDQICHSCRINTKSKERVKNEKYNRDLTSVKNMASWHDSTKNSQNHELITSDELYVSKGQAKLIKNVCSVLHDKPNLDFLTFKKRIKLLGLDYITKWMSLENFFDLMMEQKPNQISLIIEFEKLKKLFGTIPTKEQIQKNSRFGVNEYETHFKSWEDFLERLGYDPWYRDPKATPIPPRKDFHFVDDIEYENEKIVQGLLDDIISNSSNNEEIYQKISRYVHEKFSNNELLKSRFEQLLEYINLVSADDLQIIAERLN